MTKILIGLFLMFMLVACNEGGNVAGDKPDRQSDVPLGDICGVDLDRSDVAEVAGAALSIRRKCTLAETEFELSLPN